MNEASNTQQVTDPKPGRGFTVKRVINGREIEVPWGFTTSIKEGKAAKAAGIEYPGTSRAAEGQ